MYGTRDLPTELDKEAEIFRKDVELLLKCQERLKRNFERYEGERYSSQITYGVIQVALDDTERLIVEMRGKLEKIRTLKILQ